MRLKLLLVTVFAAGVGASYALADAGHGNQGQGDHGSKCTEVHVNGTIAGQTLTVTLPPATCDGPALHNCRIRAGGHGN